MSIVTFGGYPCLDPERLRGECADRNMPTDWYGTVNRFDGLLGERPGRGAVLLTTEDADRLDPKTDHVLTFDDGTNPAVATGGRPSSWRRTPNRWRRTTTTPGDCCGWSAPPPPRSACGR
jgi:hypothetical protein